jgi:hypothetical protein
MASVYKRGDKQYIRYRDARGKWRDKVCAARTKTEAKRLAGELERKCERQRLGLEALPDEDGGGTFDELMNWWLVTYSKGSPSHQRSKYSVEKNLIGSELGALRLVEVTPGAIEVYLQARRSALSADTKSLAPLHRDRVQHGQACWPVRWAQSRLGGVASQGREAPSRFPPRRGSAVRACSGPRPTYAPSAFTTCATPGPACS